MTRIGTSYLPNV